MFGLLRNNLVLLAVVAVGASFWFFPAKSGHMASKLYHTVVSLNYMGAISKVQSKAQQVSNGFQGN